MKEKQKYFTIQDDNRINGSTTKMNKRNVE